MPKFNSEQKRSFTHILTVRPGDIDDMGHVNNVVYLRWVQEAAEAHWNAHAPETLRAAYSWVVLRHEIDYLAAAMPGDTILAKTWVESYSGVRSERVVQLYRKGDERLLAEAKTNWCLLDSVRKKPHRIEEDITTIFAPETH